MEEQMFTPDYSKPLYDIVINVFENGSVLTVKGVQKGYKPRYQELIGTLETVKLAYCEKQRKINEATAQEAGLLKTQEQKQKEVDTEFFVVEVMKASKPDHWYNDLVGARFKVMRPYESYEGWRPWIVIAGEHKKDYIEVEDAEIIY